MDHCDEVNVDRFIIEIATDIIYRVIKLYELACELDVPGRYVELEIANHPNDLTMAVLHMLRRTFQHRRRSGVDVNTFGANLKRAVQCVEPNAIIKTY